MRSPARNEMIDASRSGRVKPQSSRTGLESNWIVCLRVQTIFYPGGSGINRDTLSTPAASLLY